MNKKIEDQEMKYLEIDQNERKKFKLSTSSLINGIVGIGVVGAGVGKLISDDIAIKKYQDEDILTTPIWIVDETKEKILEDSLKEVDEEYRTTIINFAKYKLVIFVMAKFMEMEWAEQNKVTLYLFNSINMHN